MPIYLTVQQFQNEYSKHIKDIHVKTIYRWIEEQKLTVKKDHGGHGWLIIIDESDPIYPFIRLLKK